MYVCVVNEAASGADQLPTLPADWYFKWLPTVTNDRRVAAGTTSET